MAFFDPALRWIQANKAVFVLSVLLFAFFISTIALAARKNSLANELGVCQDSAGESVVPHFQYRLTDQVIPIHYDLTLRPDLDADSFEGVVKIKVNVLSNTRQFAIHKGTDMKILKAEVLGASQNFALTPTYNATLDYVILTLNGVLLKAVDNNYHTISIEFASENMSKSNLGFYSSTYMDGGQQHKMVSSKFQPTYARRAFPCFDEPGYKAKFTVTLVTPGAEYTALSNMDVEKIVPDGTRQVVTFKESVAMSTYLSVFMVSKLVPAHTAKLEGTDTQFTVYTAPDQKEDGQYAFEVGKKLTEFYIDYFGVPYPLNKLDMAGIPEYPTGATEHWGLITFRQSSLLYNPDNNSARNKKSVASVISHELVHQWFGNLVTMHWWNDIWLNEGFASYIEYKGLAKAEPTWEIIDSFTIDDLHSVLVTDSLPSTRAIIKDAESPDEITALFDSIAYNKAASIIRMLDDFVGEENFRRSVTKYLTDFKYQSTVTSDFLNCFKDLNLAFDVAEIMDTWTSQAGYPLVTVSRINDTFVKLTQQRFAVNTQTAIEAKKYTIPIRFRTNAMQATESTLVWMTKDQESVEVDLGGLRAWYKFNENQIGYYRVNYEPAMWTELAKLLNTWREDGTNTLSPLNRAHLLNDVIALADGEYLQYSTALEMLDYLPNERNLVPWSVATSQIKKLLALMELDSPDVFVKLSAHFHELALDAYDHVKFSGCSDLSETETEMDDTTTTPPPEGVCSEDEDSFPNQLLRERLVDLMCRLEHDECLKEVDLHFDAFLHTNTPVSPNVRQSVYYYGLQEANVTTWSLVFDMLKVETDPQEVTKLMVGLSATKNPVLISLYISRAWEELRNQDFFTVLNNLAENASARLSVWAWVRDNWEKLVERYTINERTLGRVIPSVTARFSTQAQLDELNAFFGKYPEAGAGAAAREEAKETITKNIRWMAINKPIISAWLDTPKEQ